MIIKLSTLTFQTEIYKFESKSDQILNAYGINDFFTLNLKGQIFNKLNNFFNLGYFIIFIN